jgi:hypothetical protein
MQVTRGEGLSAGINLRISGGGAIGRVDINTLSKGLASGSAMVRLTQERSAGSSMQHQRSSLCSSGSSKKTLPSL